jgi:hypothetical protein
MTVALVSLIAVVTIVGANGRTASQTAAKAKVPVSIEWTGEDLVGRRLVYHIRETIGQSSLYEQSTLKVNEVSVVSADTHEERQGNASVVSALYSTKGVCGKLPDAVAVRYVSHAALLVGVSRAEESAKDIVAGFADFLTATARENRHCSFIH